MIIKKYALSKQIYTDEDIKVFAQGLLF